MPFTPRLFEDIARSMIDYIVAEESIYTDFTEGSNVRTLSGSSAQELQRLYMQTTLGIQEGTILGGFGTFGFQRQNAFPAVVFETFPVPAVSGPTTITLPIGTRVGVGGTNIQYALLSEYSVMQPDADTSDPDSTLVVPMTCLLPGSLGNVPNNSVTVWISSPIEGFGTPYNSGVVQTGRDTESFLQQQTRFSSFINGLQRGTLRSMESGALTASVLSTDLTERVALSLGMDNSKDGTIDPGVVTIYIYNGIGSQGGYSTSSDLIAATLQIMDGSTLAGVPIPGYKPAGTPCTVLAAQENLCAVTVSNLFTVPGIDSSLVLGGLTQAIRQYFSGLAISDGGYSLAGSLILSGLRLALSSAYGVLDYTLVVKTDVDSVDSDGTIHGGTIRTDTYTPPEGDLLLLATYGIIIQL